MGLALEIDGLRFRYRTDGPWIVRVDRLSLGAGERVLIEGPSGRGKSTLLHLISGVVDLRPERGSGRVVVGGTDVHGLRGAARDRFRGGHIGIVFQTFNLLPAFTALENVMLAMLFSGVERREHERRARALLDRLGVERALARPDELSVGQQQRVALARALVCEPALVLADEPTASLDPERAHDAMGLLLEACAERGAALLCVSHDPAMRARFDRRATLDSLAGEGSAASDGSLAAVGGGGAG